MRLRCCDEDTVEDMKGGVYTVCRTDWPGLGVMFDQDVGGDRGTIEYVEDSSIYASVWSKNSSYLDTDDEAVQEVVDLALLIHNSLSLSEPRPLQVFHQS